MKVYLSFFILFFVSTKAQQGIYTLAITSVPYSQSVTCRDLYVTHVLESNYTLSPLSYSWTNGNASYTGTVANISSAGIYTITAYAGASLIHTATLTVSSNTISPVITLSPVAQTISCISQGVPVIASSNVQVPVHYFVSPFGGSLTVVGQGASYLPGAPGTYTYVLMDSLNGCKSERTFTIVALPGFPTFSISSAENFTVGCSTKSVATISITQASTNPPGGSLSYTITQVPSYITAAASGFSLTGAGVYTVVVKDNTTNCESQVPLSINRNSFVPWVYGNLAGTFTCKEPKLLLNYFPLPPGNYTFGWGYTHRLQPGIILHPFDTISVFADPSPDSVGYYGPWAITINNENLCVQSITTWLNQDMLPPTVGIKAGRPDITCKNPYVALTCTARTNSPFFNFGAGAYLWEGPLPQVSGTLSSGYLAYVAGVYTVHARDNYNGCTNTNTILVKDSRIYPLVSAPARAFELCNSMVTIQPVVSSTSTLIYAWTTGTNSVFTSTAVSQLAVGSAGVYTVVVTDSLSGCSGSTQLTVILCTGIEERYLSTNTSLVYPNPANHSVFIEATSAQHLQVTDALARPLSEQDLEEGKIQLDLSSFPPGVYFIKLSGGLSAQKSFKIIKEN